MVKTSFAPRYDKYLENLLRFKSIPIFKMINPVKMLMNTNDYRENMLADVSRSILKCRSTLYYHSKAQSAVGHSWNPQTKGLNNIGWTRILRQKRKRGRGRERWGWGDEGTRKKRKKKGNQ